MPRLLSRIVLAFLISTLALACATSPPVYRPPAQASAVSDSRAVYPETAFVVITDPHVYDSSLGVTGSAFQAYLDRDRKLLRESVEIFETAVAAAAEEAADFVIVCGDMTKDGERVNHLLAAETLGRLTRAGKKVFVVPGNHDVANGEAVRFIGDRTEPVPTVSPEAFVDIYGDYGYKAALDRDPTSLSYLAEPVPGLWLLAVDSCKWRLNRPGHHSPSDFRCKH